MAYYSSPGELWGALSNVFGQGTDWLGQGDNALGVLAGAGTAMGVGGQVAAAMQASNRAREMSRLARQPMQQPTLDVSQFYQPMTDAARDAYTRQLRSEMAGYGVPMTGAYAANAVAEGLAKTEAGRMSEAQRNALNKYGTDAGMNQNQRYFQLNALGQRPNFPGFGDTSALGSFLRYRAAQQARERGTQQPGATFGTPTGQPQQFVGGDELGQGPGVGHYNMGWGNPYGSGEGTIPAWQGGGPMPSGIPPSNYQSTMPNVSPGQLYGQDAEWF